MCRLPQDVMAMIIRLLRQPLPKPGDMDATWANLHQADLTRMMRVCKMTYYVTAPILYEEVVVKNLSALIHGATDPVQAHHHEGCVHLTGSERQQRFICNFVSRGSTGPYDCSRHPRSDGTNTGDRFTAGRSTMLWHKQELLAMVKAVHLVFSAEDEGVYNNYHQAIGDQQEIEWDKVEALTGMERYTEARRRTDALFLNFWLTPNLERMTLASWMSGNWDVPAIHPPIYDDIDTKIRFELCERNLAWHMIPLLPQHICRNAQKSPFAHYLSADNIWWEEVHHNVIHNASYCNFNDSLIGGTENVIHFAKVSPLTLTDIDDFIDNADDIVNGVAWACRHWMDQEGILEQDLPSSWITFCIRRHAGTSNIGRHLASHGDTTPETAAALAHLMVASAAHEEELLDEWIAKVNIIWADERGPCEACGAEVGSDEIRKPVSTAADQYTLFDFDFDFE